MRLLFYHQAMTSFNLATIRPWPISFGTREQWILISILCYIFLFVNVKTYLRYQLFAGSIIHFCLTSGYSCKSVNVFETENVSTRMALEHPIFEFMPNVLTIWAVGARYFLSHVLEHWLWWYRYFLCKLNMWNANCVRATAFIFNTRTDVLVKVLKFFRQKLSRPEGDTNPDNYRMQPWVILGHVLLLKLSTSWIVLKI